MFNGLKKLFSSGKEQERQSREKGKMITANIEQLAKVAGIKAPTQAKPVKVARPKISKLTRMRIRWLARNRFWLNAKHRSHKFSKRWKALEEKRVKSASLQIDQICGYYKLDRKEAHQILNREQSVQAVRKAGRQAGLRRPA